MFHKVNTSTASSTQNNASASPSVSEETNNFLSSEHHLSQESAQGNLEAHPSYPGAPCHGSAGFLKKIQRDSSSDISSISTLHANQGDQHSTHTQTVINHFTAIAPALAEKLSAPENEKILVFLGKWMESGEKLHVSSEFKSEFRKGELFLNPTDLPKCLRLLNFIRMTRRLKYEKLSPIITKGTDKTLQTLFWGKKEVAVLLPHIETEYDQEFMEVINRSFKKETELLDRLEELGFSVAKHFGVIAVVREKKSYPALLMRYYPNAVSSATIIKNTGYFRNKSNMVTNLNEVSEQDLLDIKARLIEKKIRIDDMQFLILANGKLVFADPREVKEDGFSEDDIHMIDRFIEMAKTPSL